MWVMTERAFHTGVVLFLVDSWQLRPSAGGIGQIHVTAVTEFPRTVYDEFFRVLWVLVCGVVAVFALNFSMLRR